MRLVQFAIVRDAICALRSGTLAGEILSLSRNTVNKLNQLQVTGKTQLSNGEISDVADSYKYFLWRYHKSQESYHTKGEMAVPFDIAEVKERCVSLDKICSKRIIQY